MVMSKSNQLFKGFVKEQKTLNEFKIREIDFTIEEILDNPKKFGKEYVENNISRNFKNILKAKKLGTDFAKKNIQNQ